MSIGNSIRRYVLATLYPTRRPRGCFSVYQCFATINDESHPLVLAQHLSDRPGLALWNGSLVVPLLEVAGRRATP